ncbi:alanyl-tRNA editing protein [Herbaspirillum sp.]|jgi:alanyl-tRNA synthetase|uniref:alanyl-tRNA editing protein n=1 Tax=Herbaspirillum TaxID=963 RepID=UPI0025898E4C|nr:alanyl-tRNA editing protein [Herbaspirillum sp.]MCP3658169.1 alanyl-tRNA editing protein [Herbaspirillum sp.]MCP3950394.1 alanyl-tRNA editing protein [Herbaspirillum sp.]MCP4033522.1 alanyl-tRNA editing protein [Herbaspirillum sp.]MCP4554819.1 alanyl-tRNA editing protein [Herbaspirillum sp.]
MTHKLFWSAPYQTELDTTVTAVDGDQVQIAQTIFFAFSGGQESDAGTLGGHPVLQAEKRDQTIVYTLPPGHGLRVGDAVHLQVDWARRYRLMRLHFAAEMVLQLVYQMRPGIERIGAHIAMDKARVDFASDTSLAPLFPAIEAAAQELVAAGLPIVTAFSDEAAGRRYWEVEGFARMACGGTHPRTTVEVGTLRLKRKNTGRGKERIEILLDAPA